MTPGHSQNNTEYVYTTNAITSNCTVTATFAQNISHIVLASAGANGSLDSTTPSPQTVNDGERTSFKFNADLNYHVSGITGCGISYSNTSNAVNTYTVETGPITADCTVTATFAINTYIVTPIVGEHGTISPSTPQTVVYGATMSFTVTPDPGYHITSISGCGGTDPGILQNNMAYVYTTGQITADCAVTATFQRYPVKKTSGETTTYHESLLDALSVASSGTIECDAITFVGDHILNSDISVTLIGGVLVDNQYPESDYTTIKGSLTINGTVTIEKFIVQ